MFKSIVLKYCSLISCQLTLTSWPMATCSDATHPHSDACRQHVFCPLHPSQERGGEWGLALVLLPTRLWPERLGRSLHACSRLGSSPVHFRPYQTWAFMSQTDLVGKRTRIFFGSYWRQNKVNEPEPGWRKMKQEQTCVFIISCQASGPEGDCLSCNVKAATSKHFKEWI